MGKVTRCSFVFSDNSNSVYRPGDDIKGKVCLEVSGEISANAVKLRCFGAAFTRWSPFLSRINDTDPRSKERYVDMTRVLYGGKGSDVKLSEGQHVYDFKFSLPRDSLPASFEGERGAIRYWLRILVDKTFPGIDYSRFKPFTILHDADMGVAAYKKPIKDSRYKTVSKVLGFGNAGSLTLSVSLDRCGYCPGEKILINVEAKNDSTKDCGAIVAKLIQKLFFSVGEDTTRREALITHKRKDTLKHGEKVVWNREPLTIPAIPPSTKPRSCHIIDVKYIVKVEAEVHGGFDLEIELPITIGTIPAGVTKSVKKLKDKDGNTFNRVAFSPPLTYKQCTTGFEQCSKTDDDLPFPNISFTPFTVFHESTIQSQQNKTFAAASPPSMKENPKAMLSSASGLVNVGQDNTLPKNPGLVPTAPPPVDAPPAYDSIFPSAASPSIASPPIANLHGARASTASKEWKGAAMGLIFPESCITQMIDHFRLYNSTLTQSNGIIIGFFDPFQIFPSKSSSAIFVIFPSEALALTWFEHFQRSSHTPGVQVLLGENNEPLTKPRDMKLFPFITVYMNYKNPDIGNKLSKDEQQEKNKLIKTIFTSSKEKFGGGNIISSTKVKLLTGDWSDLACFAKDITLLVHQWPSKEHCLQWTDGTKTHIDYNKYIALCRGKPNQLVRALSTTESLSTLLAGGEHWRGAGLVLVFPPTDMAKMIEYLKNNLKSLASNNGTVFAVFDKFEMTPSSPKSAMFVMFPSQTPAMAWFDLFQSSSPISKIQVMFVENSTSLPKPMDSKLYPCVRLSMSLKTGYENNQVGKDLNDLIKSFILPLKDKYGGKKIVQATPVKFLLGDWSELPCSDNNVFCVINQWPSKNHLDAFSNEVTSHHDYNKYVAFRNIFYSQTINADTELTGDEIFESVR